MFEGSPTGGGGDWIGTPVPIIGGGTSPRMNPAKSGLLVDGVGFFAIIGVEVGACGSLARSAP